jgi:protein TonB
MTSRYGSAVLISSGITFVLFLIMQMLVATGNSKLVDEEVVRFIGVVQKIIDDPAVKEILEPVPPPPVEEEPVLETPPVVVQAPGDVGGVYERPPVTLDPHNAGLYVDGALMPIVRVQPVYPRRAIRDDVEGYTIVEFTVTEHGSVENPVVIYAEPKGYFESASEKAVLKFKYKPQVVNGEPIRVTGQRTRFTFELGEK